MCKKALVLNNTYVFLYFYTLSVFVKEFNQKLQLMSNERNERSLEDLSS